MMTRYKKKMYIIMHYETADCKPKSIAEKGGYWRKGGTFITRQSAAKYAAMHLVLGTFTITEKRED